MDSLGRPTVETQIDHYAARKCYAPKDIEALRLSREQMNRANKQMVNCVHQFIGLCASFASLAHCFALAFDLNYFVYRKSWVARET